MDELTQLNNEYQRLRDEIMQADSRNYQMLGVIIAAAAALLAAAFSRGGEKPSLIALLVYAVTIPGYRMLYVNRKRIWRISTYMRVFLESRLQYTQWETRLSEQREKASPDRRNDFSTFALKTEWLTVSLINFVAALCAAWAMLDYEGVARLILPILGLPTLICGNVCLWKWTHDSKVELERLGKVEKGFLESWEALKKSQ